jgi:GNAT superfamily N-acetyltransferase
MTLTATVRLARRGDITALDALYARSYPKLLKADYPPSALVLALPLISRVQPYLVTCGTYFVAEAEDGTILGAGGWTPQRNQTGCGDVRHLVTDDRHTRRGVGRALFDRIFSSARAAGIGRLDCNATRTAVPFYQAMGFTALGPIEIDLRPGITFPAVRMQCRLTAAPNP